MKTRLITLLIVIFAVVGIAYAQKNINIYKNGKVLYSLSVVDVDSIKFENKRYHNGYEYVDLGFSSGIKWATCNVGANSPEEYGEYFAWGEITTKKNYNWGTYKYCNGSSSTLTKYCTNSNYGIVDDKTILDLEDDVASVRMGGEWRMPTRIEQEELLNNCTWEWTEENGVDGYRVTSHINSNSIFLPAAGYHNANRIKNGNYWSSSVDSSCAYYLNFNEEGDIREYIYNRSFGFSVRAVYDSRPVYTVSVVSSNENNGKAEASASEIKEGDEITLVATPEEGYRFVSWSINGEKVSCINPFTINVTSDVEVVAKFKELPKQPLRILAIGNSWSTNATQYLKNILANLGIEATVYNVVKGGASLKGYYNNTINNTREYFWTINGVRDDNDGNNYSISEILDKGEFDIITVQQVSGDGGAYDKFQPYIIKFIYFIEDKEAYDPIIYFHSTWAFPDFCNHPYLENKYEGSSDVMYSSIFSTWRNIIKDENMDKIIPSTYAVQEIRKIEGIGDIDQPDGRHLSPIGCFAVGCVWAETFIKDLGLNNSIFDLTYNPTSLSSEHFNLIKNIAKTAVERRGIDYNISYDNINK